MRELKQFWILFNVKSHENDSYNTVFLGTQGAIDPQSIIYRGSVSAR